MIILYLRAPKDKPLIKWVFIKGSIKKAGSIDIIVAAATKAISTPLWVWRVDKPIGNVFVSLPDRIREKINSFQLKIILSKKEATNAGLINGKVISKKALNLDAPSILAACSSIKRSFEKKDIIIHARKGNVIELWAKINPK